MADMFVSRDGGLEAISADGAMSLSLIPTVIEAMRRAVEEVGYENLDGRAVKEAMDSIKDFDPHGIGKTITYTPEDHRGSATVRIYEVRGGEAVSVTDWREAPMLAPEG